MLRLKKIFLAGYADNLLIKLFFRSSKKCVQAVYILYIWADEIAEHIMEQL